MDRYFKDIKHLPRVSIKREKELSNIILGSSNPKEVENAVKEMVEGNVRLALKYAFDYHRRYSNSLSKMDLIAEANSGLVKAAQKYDATTGNRFSTYAVCSICREMDRAIQNSRMVSIPLSHFKYLTKLQNLLDEHGEDIEDSVLMEKLDITASMLNALKRDLKSGVKIEFNNESTLINIGADMDLVEHNDPSKNIQSHELKEELTDAIEMLLPIEKEIITLKHFSGDAMTFEEIASKYDFTRQYASQIHDRALKKLKRFMKNKNKRINKGVKNEKHKNK